jgi:hypothetical protein
VNVYLHSIKKVLFHELTHNVYSEHDAKFFTLMSQVEKECAALDWTNAGGASVGGGSGIARIDDDDDDRSARSTGYELGGGTSTSRLLLSQQQVATKEEPFRHVAALPDSGGVSTEPTPAPKDLTETSPASLSPDTPATSESVLPSRGDQQSHEETTRPPLSHDMNPTPAAPSAGHGVTKVKSSSPRASAVDDGDVEMTDASSAIVGIPGYEPSTFTWFPQAGRNTYAFCVFMAR